MMIMYDMKRLPLVCHKLEELKVRCYFLDDIWFNFARTNNLTKLALYVQYDGPTIKCLMKMAAYWPNLEEVTTQLDSVSADEVIQFINTCKHLKKLNISDESGNRTEKYLGLGSKLENEWKLVPMITKCYCYDFEHSIIRSNVA